MKKRSAAAARIGVMAFFAAVLCVSAAMMLKKDEPALQTVNTITAEPTDTSELSEETERRYGHDIDFQMSPEVTSADVETDTELITEPPQSEANEETSVSSVSRTIITSRQRKEYDSNSVYIDMENILQNPELPVGCEITALTILLRFYGFNADKVTLAKDYLPVSWGNPQTIDGKLYKDSFFDYFIGDPFSKGYGCFSPAVEKAANAYIADNGGGYTVKNISGCHPDTLYEYLIAGTPVLCWATDGMIEPEYYESWYDNATGERLDWYLNEHCFVLAGFDIANSTVTLNDPMKGIIDYNIDRFEVRFKQMYSQAIVIIPDGGEDIMTEQSTQAPVTEVSAETEVPSLSEETAAVGEDIADTEQAFTVSESDISSDSEQYIDTDFFTGSFISD